MIFNNTENGSVVFNGISLDKVVFNSLTVWENWKLLTGYYNRMTASNTPFKVTTTSTANFKNPYVLFDEDWTTNPTFNADSGFTIEQDLLEAKIIPTKIEVMTNTKTSSSDAFKSTNTISVSENGTDWVEFGRYDYVGHSLQTNTTKVLNHTLEKPIRYVKLTISKKSDSANNQTGGHGFRIVEWYQKGN